MTTLDAFDTQVPAQGSSPLRAFALDTHRELWTASGFGDDQLLVDHDAVFVTRDEQVLVADAGPARAVQTFGWIIASVITLVRIGHDRTRDHNHAGPPARAD